MILDRVEYTNGHLGGQPAQMALAQEYCGIRQNDSGMSCLAIRDQGTKRAKLIEVGFVQRIETDGHMFEAPPYQTWQQRVSEIEAFIAEASSPAHNSKAGLRKMVPAWLHHLFG